MTTERNASDSDPRLETPPCVALSLADLRMFLVVAAEGSFSRAADKVCRTQPAVSQAVRRLEQDVGQQLLTRSSNPVQLSAAGILLQDYGRQLFALCDEAKAALDQLSDAHARTVVMGTCETMVHAALPIVSRFRQRVIGAQVDLRCIPKSAIAGQVASGALDFAVTTERPSNSTLSSTPLATGCLVALMHPHHPLASRRTLSLSDLHDVPLMIHHDWKPEQELWNQGERRRPHTGGTMAIPSLDAIKRLLESQQGLAVLPRNCAAAEIARGTLVAVPIAELKPIAVVLVHRHERHLSEIARSFLALTREEGGSAIE